MGHRPRRKLIYTRQSPVGPGSSLFVKRLNELGTRLLDQRPAISLAATKLNLLAELSTSQWDLIAKVVNILQVFDKATFAVSTSSVCASEIIPIINSTLLELQKPSFEALVRGKKNDRWLLSSLVGETSWSVMPGVVKTGAYRYEDGTNYVGDWNPRGQKHGMGHMALPDGTRYDGAFQNGLCSGLGIMCFPDGAK
uniref:MORN repeat-containing protein n=1 Tax=Timema genevievae TaxID=629358 RepID=A0A7R9K7J8_TIMGE|nr:unnamed protein product [Timema genevievae]